MGFDLLTNGLTIDDWQPEQAETTERDPCDYDLPTLTQAVFSLPPAYYHEYEKWLHTGMALYGTDPNLLYLWEQFSRQSLTNYCPGACEQKWATFRDHDGPRLSAGSIFHWAREAAQCKTEPQFQLFNLDNLLSGDFRVTYLIDGYLVAGQPCLCVGPQKSLKTTLLLYMALCIAAGTEFLGKACKKSRVLFMSGESGMATLKETVQRILATMLVKPEPDDFILSPDLPHLARPLGELQKLLKEREIDVLIIDPAYLAMDGTEAGNMFSMGPQLRTIAQVCNGLEITLIIAHHCTKAAGREHEPLELADIAWSGFAEFARQWLLLSRRESYIDGTGEHQLFLRAGGSAGHSSLVHLDVSEGTQPNRHWKIDAKSYGEVVAAQQDRQYQADLAKVCEVLEDAGEPLAQTTIKNKARIRHDRWRVEFPLMIADGHLVEVNHEGHTRYVWASEQSGETE